MPGNEYKTNNRTRIKDFLIANSNRTVTVSDIRNHLEMENCPVNVTTIYRYLDKLEKSGELMRYTSDIRGKSTYQYSSREHKCDEHLHLKCCVCGEIIHLDCHFMDEITEHISKEHGFDIQCRNSIIYGVCDRCRQLK